MIMYVLVKYVDLPYADATVIGACVTSLTLSLTMYTNSSTCRFYSYQLYLTSSGRTIQPASYNNSYYQFNKLTTNTRHSVKVTFRHGVDVNTTLVGYANTPASRRKFLCSCTIQTYVIM